MVEPTSPAVNFVDNPHAPDVFATDAAGFFRIDGNIMIAFESLHVDHVTSPGPVNRVVIGRLVLPIPAAQRLALSLFDFLKRQGFDPAESVTPEGASAN